jgi:glyoxylase-like metal-dependent hydrolase (beta-lactamase superfamily II)
VHLAGVESAVSWSASSRYASRRRHDEGAIARAIEVMVATAASGTDSQRLVIAEELDGNVIKLEGHDLNVVEVGHTDTHDTTVLHVPALGLVVAGDAAYNRVHQLLSETDAQKRRQWIAALDKVESLKPRTVIAGHKRPGSEDSPRIIEETRQYIQDFDRLVETTTTARELYDRMLRLYPRRMNLNPLWTSALAIKG